jgi:hypothetical protein
MTLDSNWARSAALAGQCALLLALGRRSHQSRLLGSGEFCLEGSLFLRVSGCRACQRLASLPAVSASFSAIGLARACCWG